MLSDEQIAQAAGIDYPSFKPTLRDRAIAEYFYQQGQKELGQDAGKWLEERIDEANNGLEGLSRGYRMGKVVALSQMQEWLHEKGLLE